MRFIHNFENLKIQSKHIIFLLCIFFVGCTSDIELINPPRSVEGLYNKSPQPVDIPSSKGQMIESHTYYYKYDDVYNSTILSLSFNKYKILIDHYEDGFISGRNEYCTYAIYLEEFGEKPTVKMTIIYDIYTNFENKIELINRDIENHFMTVYRFL